MKVACFRTVLNDEQAVYLINLFLSTSNVISGVKVNFGKRL